MDQKKIGSFLKELRNEKNLTQEQLAENFYVSGRIVSRWETGRNLPDITVLIELADFFEVDLRELLDRERKKEDMGRELKETALKVADYSSEETIRIIRRLHMFSWIGVLAFAVFLALETLGLTDSGYTEAIASFCTGLAFGILLTAVLFTSRHIGKIRAFKKKLLKHK